MRVIMARGTVPRTIAGRINDLTAFSKAPGIPESQLSMSINPVGVSIQNSLSKRPPCGKPSCGETYKIKINPHQKIGIE